MARTSRVHRKVEPDVWLDDAFLALSPPKPNAQTLWLYLLTGPRTTMIPGVVKARPAVMADDLRWPLRAWERCMAEIEAAGRARIDREAGLVVLTNALMHRGIPRETSRPNGENARKAWLSAFDSIPNCSLRDDLGVVLREFLRACSAQNSNDSGETNDDHVPDRTGTMSQTIGTQDQDQDQKQEQDQEQKVESGEPAAPVAPVATVKPDPIADLWSEQERLRAEVIPGARRLTLTTERRKKLGALLKSGYTDDDLRTCAGAYADEIRRGGDSQWFNGDTNWIPANVARTLGRIGTSSRGRDSPGGHPQPVQQRRLFQPPTRTS